MATATGAAVGIQNFPAPRFVLVSDLDHTMVQNEDPTHERLQLFNRLWTIHMAADSMLIFSTGRSPKLFLELWNEAPLLQPHVLICSVGTEIFYRNPVDGGGAVQVQYEPDAAWEAHLDRGWDRARTVELAGGFPELKLQAASEQRRHKISYNFSSDLPPASRELVITRLRQALAEAGLSAKVIYSGGVDVDILAQGAGKGKALEFILQQLHAVGKWPQAGVQVNGDSGNDVELFQVPGVRGCVVANAHPELLAFHQAVHKPGSVGAGSLAPAGVGADASVAATSDAGGEAVPSGATGPMPPAANVYLAQQPCAGGIVEAMMHFGTLDNQQQQLLQLPAAANGGVPGPSELTARNLVVQVASLQANALGGNLAPMSAPGATWVTPSGRMVDIASTHSQPGDAKAGGVAWADAVRVHPISGAPAAPAASTTDDHGAPAAAAPVVASYCLWSFSGAKRDSARCRAVSAVLAPTPEGGLALVHLHESVMAREACPTAAFEALAAAH